MNRLLHWLLLAFATLCFACGEVDTCERGTPGCFAGPPEDGNCRFDLVVRNGTCALPGDPPPPLACGCAEDELCTVDANRCVSFCEPPELERSDPPAFISCDGDRLDFGRLCRARCELSCRLWDHFCPDQKGCADSACDSEEVLAVCTDDCGADADPVGCLARMCTEVRAAGCGQIVCPDDRTPDCGEVACRNSCDGHNFDGVCDDGDLSSASSAACAFGTDCADCGPRRGAPKGRAAQGEACLFHSGCAGHDLENLANAESWCVVLDGEDIGRCAPDCTTVGRVCPEGSECTELLFADLDGDGEADRLTRDSLTASACLPTVCK